MHIKVSVLLALFPLGLYARKQGDFKLADIGYSDSRTPNVLADYQDPIDLSILPLNKPSTLTKCTSNLVSHDFANSYGKPYIGNYIAPTDCIKKGAISRVIMRYKGQVKGRQFDRFGAIYLDGYELLRTTTAEPTLKGITWSFEKDLSNKKGLFYQDRVVTHSLGNLVNDIYTGIIKIQVEVDLYVVSDGKPDDSHHIIPISKGKAQEAWFTINNEKTLTFDLPLLPKDIYKAELEVFISPHECDEFWFLNPPDSYARPRNQCANGAYREMEVYLNNNLVGGVWPFPTVYTGGITLTLWRPLSGLGSFDVPTVTLDLLPHLVSLNTKQNNQIQFEIPKATNLWLVSANLHLWTDPNQSVPSQYLIAPKVFNETKMSELPGNVTGEDGKFGISVQKKYTIASVATAPNPGGYGVNVIVSSITQATTFSQKLDISQSGQINDYIVDRKIITDTHQFQWKAGINNSLPSSDIFALLTQLQSSNLGASSLNIPHQTNSHASESYQLSGILQSRPSTGPGGYYLSSHLVLTSQEQFKNAAEKRLHLDATAFASRPSLNSSATGDCQSVVTASYKSPKTSGNIFPKCYERIVQADHGFISKDINNQNC